MKAIALAGVAFSLALSAAAFAAAPTYHVVDRIKVGNGGFDYATYDPATGRILIARTEYTTVIDTKTGKVSELKSASAGHMALPIPGTTLLLLPRGRGTIAIVDGATDKEVAEVKGGTNPDGAAYDPVSKLVFVMNHTSGDSTVVDPVAKKVVATIPIGGVLEFPVSDGAGKMFVNVEDKNELVAIDVKSMKVLAHYPLTGCEAPTGLTFVPGAKLVVSVCGQSGTAKFMSSETGAEVASIPIAMGADAVIYDAQRKNVLVPTRSGQLEVISVADPAHISVVQHVPTAVGSRTGMLDPTTGRVYMMSAKFGPPATAGGRAQALPDTFEVIVVAP